MVPPSFLKSNARGFYSLAVLLFIIYILVSHSIQSPIHSREVPSKIQSDEQLDECWTDAAGRFLAEGKVLKCNRRQSNIELQGGYELSFNESGTKDVPLLSDPFRVMFCWIPKVACTKFKALLQRIAGDPDWKRGSIHNLSEYGKMMESTAFPLSTLNNIINDDDWLRAVYIRDPVERFLSAYMDKVVMGQRRVADGEMSNRVLTNLELNRTFGPSASDVEAFIHSSPWQRNDHFTHQLNFCGFKKRRDMWNRIALYGSNVAETSLEIFGHRFDVPISSGWKDNLGMWGSPTIHANVGDDQLSLLCSLCNEGNGVFQLLADVLSEDYVFFHLPPSSYCDNYLQKCSDSA